MLAGCGDDGSLSGAGDDAKPQLVVAADASLKTALTGCAKDFPDATLRLRFAGSDELAAQIRRGVPVDVLAAANTRLPEALARARKLEEPVVFATDQLVLGVPADGAKVGSLDALERPGVKLVVGAESVPVGDHTRAVLARLGRERSKAVLANVRYQEPDVSGIVGKLAQGAADAGFVYASDVKAASGRLRAIELPAELEPTATYGAGVVAAARRPDAAEAFVDDLLAGGCHEALLAAGFGDP